MLLADRDLDSARETAEIIASEGGVAECVAADWTQAADCKAFAAACVDTWGRIDFLQNNVGIGTDDAGALRLTEDAFDRIIAVNLKGCLLSCQAVVPVMREQRSGSIVNISSIAALAASRSPPTRSRRRASTRSASRSRSKTPRTASASTRSCPGCSTRRWRSTHGRRS